MILVVPDLVARIGEARFEDLGGERLKETAVSSKWPPEFKASSTVRQFSV